MHCERCGTPCPQRVDGQITALCSQCFAPAKQAPAWPADEEADFFISYASPDVEWARLTAESLEKHGFRVIYQHRDFLYGHNYPLQIDRALRSARRIVAILSPHYMRSDYAWAEWSAAWAMHPDNESRRIIPIRVAPCRIEGLMAAIHYIDLVGRPRQHWGDSIVEAVAPSWRRLWKGSAMDAKPGAPATQDVDYFISYAPDDFRIASAAAQVLEREGYSTRLWSPEIPRTEEMRAETRDGLRAARQMLALVSQRYLESRSVWNEWSFAREAGKLLSVVKISPCETETLPSGATGLAIDVSEKTGDAFAQALLELTPLWLEGSGFARKIDYYISYAREDQHWAEFVAETLRKEGYSTRMWNPGRRMGPVTRGKIRDAIGSAAGMIGIFSQEYLNSDHPVDEWEEAAEKGIPLTAVRVSRCEPGMLLRSAAAFDLVAQTSAYAQHLLDTLAPLWMPRPERAPSKNPSQPDFFISYAEPDRKWAKFAADTLEGNGYAVLLWNVARKRGAGASRRVAHAIRSAGRTIAILSPHYLAADHTREEWSAASVFTGGRRTLALRVSPCDPRSLTGRDADLDLVNQTDEECAEALLDAVAPSWLSRWRWALRRIRGVGDKFDEVTATNEGPGYGPWGVIAPLVIAMVVSFGVMGGVGGFSPSLQTEVRAQWNAPEPGDWSAPLRAGALRSGAQVVGALLYKKSSGAPNGRADFDVSFRKGVTLLARASSRMERYYAVRVDRSGGDGLSVNVTRMASGRALRITPEVDPISGIGRQVAFALEMDGPRFRLFVNESSFARWEDSAIPTGAVGLQASEDDGVQLLRGGMELRRSAGVPGRQLVAAMVPEFKLRY